MKYITTIDGQEFIVEIVDERRVIVDGVTYEVDFDPVGNQPVFSLIIDGKSYEAFVYRSENEGQQNDWQVLMNGRLFPVNVEDEREKRLRAAARSRVVERGEFLLRAPMPGLIVSIPVSDGQEVSQGDVLVVLESMKMQNELKAPREGTVRRVRVKAGDSVEQRQILLTIV